MVLCILIPQQLRHGSYRITKATDGAKYGKATAPSKKGAAALEAGSDALSFGEFENALDAAKDVLSASPEL